MPGNKGKQLASPRPRADDPLFLLSLDGGGVRGLSSLMVLKQLMEAIDPEQPPKPCDYFDMIGGTSTGGLIAIMLGRMRLTVDECIAAYNELAPKVFTKVHRRINLRNGETQGRFDHGALEREIKALLRISWMDPEALLQEPEEEEGSPCKVFVARLTSRISVFLTDITVQIRVRNKPANRPTGCLLFVPQSSAQQRPTFQGEDLGGGASHLCRHDLL
jgi:hypothetical protein